MLIHEHQLATSPPELLPIALRAWTETPPTRRPSSPADASDDAAAGACQREDEYVLVLDTETTIDRSQRLKFGVYRYYRTRRGGWTAHVR